MKQYLEALKTIRDHEKSFNWGDRTGVGRRTRVGHEMRFDLQEGFPLVTTKKMPFRLIVNELLWFLAGDTNIKTLVDTNNHIWDQDAYRGYTKSYDFKGETLDGFVDRIATDDEFAKKHGDLGPVYGKQWRDFEGIDQLANVQNSLRTQVHNTRNIVSAWNPKDVEKMALPPCHCLYQFFIRDDKLDCIMFQRSADSILGVPFNIASYALLTSMMADAVGLEPGEFIHYLGDAHLYLNHMDQVEEQLSREPLPLPKLKLNHKDSIFDFKAEDIELENYQHHPPNPAPLNTHPMGYIVVATTKDGVIGKDGEIPWYISDDLKWFKQLTTGKPVIMGRNTYESIIERIGKPLPNRKNVVVSTTLPQQEGIHVARNLQEAISIAQQPRNPEIFFIGGERIYKDALSQGLVQRMYITHVKGDYEGDTFFPAWNPLQWRPIPMKHGDNYEIIAWQK